MANEPTDESLSEKANSDRIKEGSDDQQTKSHALEEDEGELEAEGTESDGAGSSALDETSEELTDQRSASANCRRDGKCATPSATRR